MSTRFKLKFANAQAWKMAWESEVAAGRFFIPTRERLKPFSKVRLAVGIEGVATVMEIPGEVVFVLEEAHCRPGQQPGVGVSLALSALVREAASAMAQGRWDDLARFVAQMPPLPEEQAPRPVAPVTSAPPPTKSSPRSGAPLPKVTPATRKAGLVKAPSLDTSLDARIRGEAEAFELRTRGKTHYTVLGVKLSEESSEIRATYARLMKKYHPDNYFRRLKPETLALLEEVYQRITVAYETLIVPEKRADYDISISNFTNSSSGMSARSKVARWRQQTYTNVNPKMVKLAESLIAEARTLIKSQDNAAAASKLKLALRYNPHMEEARALLRQVEDKEE